jgi:hypothetical protein
MQVQKLRGSAEDNGLVPAGQYFARLARDLETASARETTMREKLDAEDRRLEARYRRASAARGNTFASEGASAAM